MATSNYVHTLSATEEACGVTLADVARVLPMGAFFDNGLVFVIPGDTSPALAGSVARCAFGRPAEFVGLSKATGYLLYEAASE